MTSRFKIAKTWHHSATFFFTVTMLLLTNEMRGADRESPAPLTKQEAFIKANIASLTKEAAQGGGPFLHGLAEVFGCPYQPFAAFSKQYFNDLFADFEVKSIIQRYQSQIAKVQALSQGCKLVAKI